jgi:uracil-DNA glycosylase family 4
MLKPPTCKPCTLYTIGNSFSKPEGLGRSGVIGIGEALGHEEAIDGLPFRPKAQAGSKLEECIRIAGESLGGLSRQDLLLWNVIACQPPDNKLNGKWYAQKAIECCQQYLKKVIDGFNPPLGKRKVILAFGNIAFQTLTGRFDSVLDVAGFCYCLKWDEVTVIPTYHPSFIKRGNGHLTPLLAEHIKKAVIIAGQEEWDVPERYTGVYSTPGKTGVSVDVGEFVGNDNDDVPF